MANRLTKFRLITVARPITNHQHKGSSPYYSTPYHPPLHASVFLYHLEKSPVQHNIWRQNSRWRSDSHRGSVHHITPPSTHQTRRTGNIVEHYIFSSIVFVILCRSVLAPVGKTKKLRKLVKFRGFGMLIGDDDVSFFKPLRKPSGKAHPALCLCLMALEFNSMEGR